MIHRRDCFIFVSKHVIPISSIPLRALAGSLLNTLLYGRHENRAGGSMGKRGRPPINSRAMTNAERARRRREKQRAVLMAARFEDWRGFWKAIEPEQKLAFSVYADDLVICLNGSKRAILLSAQEVRSVVIITPEKSGSQ